MVVMFLEHLQHVKKKFEFGMWKKKPVNACFYGLNPKNGLYNTFTSFQITAQHNSAELNNSLSILQPLTTVVFHHPKLHFSLQELTTVLKHLSLTLYVLYENVPKFTSSVTNFYIKMHENI